MSDAQFQYDVAFSFLAQDEGVALNLNDLLRDRVRTFIYTEQQKRLAGTDGELTFSRVFRQEARLVVVLYREGWGETHWTRIEQTAIRARGYDHGYDFAKLIPLDDPAKVPPWFPKNHLYIGLKRYGAQGAAAIVEERIRDLGGTPHQESVAEHAQRVQRKLEFDKRREEFQWDKGAGEARAAVQRIPDLMRAVAETISNSSAIKLSVHLEGSFFGPVMYLQGLGRPLAIKWKMASANHLKDANLELQLLTHLPSGPGRIAVEEPRVVKTWRFGYDLLPSDSGGWIARDSQARTFSTEDLAEHLVRLYLENGRERR